MLLYSSIPMAMDYSPKCIIKPHYVTLSCKYLSRKSPFSENLRRLSPTFSVCSDLLGEGEKTNLHMITSNLY